MGNRKQEKERFKKHKIKVVEGIRIDVFPAQNWEVVIYILMPSSSPHTSPTLSANALSFFFRPITFSLSPLLHSALSS